MAAPMLLPVVADAAGIEAPAVQVRDRERTEVQSWTQALAQARTQDRPHYRKMARWRRYLAGKRGGGISSAGLDADGYSGSEYGMDNEHEVLTNFISSMMIAALPAIYARNPEVLIRPAPSVDDQRYEYARNFARTGEIVVRHYLKKAMLKRRMKGAARVSMTSGFGVLKLGYYRDFAEDVRLRDRTPDMEAQLATLRGVVQELREGRPDTVRRIELERQLEDLQASLTEQTEVVLSEGLSLDSVDPLDFVFDPGLRDMQELHRARWMAEGDWLPVEAARDLYGLTDEEQGQVTTATLQGRSGDNVYAEDEEGMGGVDGETTSILDADGQPMRRSSERYVRLWEIWSRPEQTVYTKIDGLRRWARPPFQPPRQSEDWFPYYTVIFNPLDHRRFPMSDVSCCARTRTSPSSRGAASTCTASAPCRST